MSKRIPLCLAASIAAFTPAIGQVTPAPVDSGRFSESVLYAPRVLEQKAMKSTKKKEKKSDSAKAAAVPAVVAEGETTRSFVLPVSVFDPKGSLIRDLRQNEIQVFLNDAEADIVSVEKSTEPRNVILLVDMSPSTDAGMKETKDLLGSIVESFDPSEKIMIAQFNGQMKVLSELTSNRSEVEKAIKRLKMGSGTSIYEAVDKFSSEFTGKLTGRTVLIIITDGVDTTSRKSDFAISLEAVEKTNVTVFPVFLDTFGTTALRLDSLPPGLRQAIANHPAFRPGATGTTVKEYETGRLYLNDLVRLSGGRAISYGNPIHQSMPTIGEQIRNEYLLTVKARSPIRIGERSTVRVRIARPDLSVLAKASIIPTQ